MEERKKLSPNRVGYAVVVADLIHVGHIFFFRKCKEYCDFLIIGVYTDELTSTYKRKPVIPFEERFEMVKASKSVDMVVKVENKDCTHMLKKLTAEGWKISFLFHGDDWKTVEGKEYIESIGGKLVLTPYYRHQDTTKILEKIKNG